MAERLRALVVGQNDAVEKVEEVLGVHQSGLARPRRPIANMMLLGPTGSGKTRLVEALAQVLHGSETHMVKVDCAEYQQDHEVAKLIGAPPGYVGFRETKPILGHVSMLAARSDKSKTAIVLFDEIEKAHPAIHRILLGIMDKAVLRLGDGTVSNFEDVIIFMTSNLGAREMNAPAVGFRGGAGREREPVRAYEKAFTPEFRGRVDEVIWFRKLDRDDHEEILDMILDDVQMRIVTRMTSAGFVLRVSPEARQLILDKGTDDKYGARGLLYAVDRLVVRPLAAAVNARGVPPQAEVWVRRDGDTTRIRIGKATLETLLEVSLKTVEDKKRNK